MGTGSLGEWSWGKGAVHCVGRGVLRAFNLFFLSLLSHEWLVRKMWDVLILDPWNRFRKKKKKRP